MRVHLDVGIDLDEKVGLIDLWKIEIEASSGGKTVKTIMVDPVGRPWLCTEDVADAVCSSVKFKELKARKVEARSAMFFDDTMVRVK